MYKLHIWKAKMENGLPQTDNETFEFVKKPTFQDMYPLIDCDTIEILSGFDKSISNRTFDMYCDEESKLKTPIIKNKRATEAWYEWQRRTKRSCIPGDFIAGSVAVIKKVKDAA